tara:strand:+ start:73 stop:561 length:489 start_codon:yes stop_codon:yes gene_type:complete
LNQIPLEQPVIAVGIVTFKDDKILMIRRGKPPRKGQWSIPGGKQKLGETWRAAAAREVKEETGIDIEVLGLIDVVDAIIYDEQTPKTKEKPLKNNIDNKSIIFHYTLVDCVAEWVSGTVNAGSDAAHAEWLSLPQIKKLDLWSETLRIINEAIKIRKAAHKN